MGWDRIYPIPPRIWAIVNRKEISEKRFKNRISYGTSNIVKALSPRDSSDDNNRGWSLRGACGWCWHFRGYV